jgi:hypothetical protein
MGVKRGLSLEELERRIYIWGNYESVLSRMFGSEREVREGRRILYNEFRQVQRRRRMTLVGHITRR